MGLSFHKKILKNLEPYRIDFTLDGASIDSFSEKIYECFSSVNIEEQNILRIRLSMEETLLRMRDKFGAEKEVSGFIGKYRGKYVVQVEALGEAYNPLGEEYASLEDICTSLFASAGINPQYSYSGQKNSFKITVAPPRINPVVKVIAALVLGSIIGSLGLVVIDADVQEMMVNMTLDPITDGLNRLIMTIAGIVIFLMLTTSILNAGRINEQGGDSNRVLFRYLGLSSIMGAFALFVVTTVLDLTTSIPHMDAEEARGILEYILGFIPADLITPVIEANTPQLIVMAVLLGSAINIFGSQVNTLTAIIRQLNAIGLQFCEWIGRIIPYVICILVALDIWRHKNDSLAVVAASIATSVAIAVICVIVMTIYTSRKERVPIRFLVSTLKHSFLLVLKTGSLDEAYGQAERSIVNGLGINKFFVEIGFPTGLVFYMPISAVGTVVCTLFVASNYGIAIPTMGYVTIIFLAVLLSVASPPVPGVDLITFVAIFSQIGIPAEALVEAMIFSIMFGIFASACNQLLLQYEMLIQGDKLGFLNRTRLPK